MKISIIGASGDVGQEFFKRFSSSILSHQSEICLFFHSVEGKAQLVGLVNDELQLAGSYRCKITDRWSDLLHSDICIVCAGAPIDRNPMANNKNINNRDTVRDMNLPVVLKVVKNTMNYCPECLVILVTNPVSSIIAEVLSIYPSCKIVGCGVTNDTLRVRSEVRREYPDYDSEGLFVVGEHDIRNQEVIRLDSSRLPDRIDIKFGSLEDKLAYISKLKSAQNSEVVKGGVSHFSMDAPLLYRSYFRHRLSHFLYKTHVSTACCILAVINAYENEGIPVCVETADRDFRFVVGAPVIFREGMPVICSLPSHSICMSCREKYIIK